VTATDVTLTPQDGYALAGRLYAQAGRAPAGIVIINSATAVPQAFYARYARYLADAGVHVLTYDYRGIGGSRPPSLRGFGATLTDWAKLDARAAFDYAAREYEDVPLAFVGHSFGGQLIALLDEARSARGAVFVGAQFGYYGSWPALQRARLALYWYALAPVLSHACGYMPGKVGLGVDLPAGVALEWARWCRNPDYLFAYHPDAEQRMARFSRRSLLYSFTDDDFAPRAAVAHFVRMASNPELVERVLSPAALGAKEVGHFGFFRPAFKDSLWQESRRYLLDVLAGRQPEFEPEPSRPARIDEWQFDFRSDILADLEYGRS
jgi:predicted alpha/beta hydrolase